MKKIIHADEDISNCSNNAAFAITIATEQFLKYLVEQTHNVVKSERKQRRNIQYRDVGVSRLSLIISAFSFYCSLSPFHFASIKESCNFDLVALLTYSQPAQ